MAALTALRPEVLPHVSECPIPIVDDAILKAVIEFCNRSRAYRFSPSAISVVAGTANYAVSDLPAGMVIAWLLAAELDDDPLDLLDPGTIPQSWATETGSPSTAIVYSETTIGLRKAPDAAGSLSVKLALRPALTATTYPDEFHNLYQERIAAGALAKLYAQPNRPWSNPLLVADCRSRFDSGILDAEYRADRGNSNAPGRTALCLVGRR